MGRYRWIGALLITTLLGAVLVPGVRAEICNRVVAIVNEDVITLFELNKKIKEVTGALPGELRKEGEDKYHQTRRQVLDLLIDERVAESKIKELGIRVDQKQVDATIERIKALNRWTQEDLILHLEEEGLTYDQFVQKVKEDLLRINLINYEVKSKIIIREESIRAYYEENRGEFGTEGEVHLAGIFLRQQVPEDESERSELMEKGKAAMERLKNGTPFETLTREISEGPSAQAGGDLGTFKVTQLGPAIRKALESVPVGGHTGVIVKPEGIQIIKVLDRKRGETRSFEDVKDAIYDTLYRKEVNARYIAWIRDLRDHSYTKIFF